jgi:hypothetical protein
MSIRPPILRPLLPSAPADSLKPSLIFAQVQGKDQGCAAAAPGMFVCADA